MNISNLSIEILDLGINNIRSVINSVGRAGGTNLKVISNASESRNPKLFILPGLGNFGSAVTQLKARGFDELLHSSDFQNQTLLGICLGMQLLVNKSEESIGINGLGFIDGDVRLFPDNKDFKVPNVGWNEVKINKKYEFKSLDTDKDFYFVHSYYTKVKDNDNILCNSYLGDFSFTSGIIQDRIIGFQFHPEKSSTIGQNLIREILEFANE